MKNKKNKKDNKRIRVAIETPFVFFGLLLVCIKLLDGIKTFNNWNKR